jgi:hypothetical protein
MHGKSEEFFKDVDSKREESDYLRDRGVNRGAILKRTLKKQSLSVWTGLSWYIKSPD